MSDPRKEDILDLLNKTWSPCCSTALGLGQLTAFGNTPPVDLFKDLDMGKKLDVLLMQQGDLRNIMKTVAAMKHDDDNIEEKCVPDEITFRFVDKEPASIVRNILMFDLLDTIEDKTEDFEYLWNVWFNCLLSRDDAVRVHNAMVDLEYEKYESQNNYKPKPKKVGYKRKWKVADENTKERVWSNLRMWTFFDEYETDREVSDMHKGLFTFQRYGKQDPEVSRRYSTKWPYKRFGKFQSEVKTWNKYGVLAVGCSVTEDATCPNPTMYREEDCYLEVQRDLCPFAAFCPLVSDDVDGSSLTEACFTEFIKMVKGFREMLRKVKVHIDFEVGDTLEYLSTHKEKKYDLIHTSNMADVYGLTNTLLVSEPLLKHENSVLITTTEEHVYEPRNYYVTSQTACRVNMLPIFLGVQIAENLALGQNFIGRDSPVQVYRWMKSPEANPVRISLIDSPELVGDFRTFFEEYGGSDFCSAMSLATVFKRFQERITDSPDFIMDNIIKDILQKPYLKSFLLVCKMLGIFPSKPLRIVKAKLNAFHLGIVGPMRTRETIFKAERLLLTQPSLFSSFISEKYQTDTYYCDRHDDTLTLLIEEEEYNKMLEYQITCASRPDVTVSLSKLIKEKNTLDLNEVKQETKKTEQIFVRERIESYIVTLDFKGDLVDGSPTVVFDDKPCRVSVGFTDSNGKTKIPFTLNCQLTSEFHSINVDKSTRQISVTLYKECLQRLGNNLLPLSTIDFDSTIPCLEVAQEARGVLAEYEKWLDFVPKPGKGSSSREVWRLDLSTVRTFVKDMALKTQLTGTENALCVKSITKEQLFIKFDQIYVIDGYPVMDITFHIIEDDQDKITPFLIKAAQNGWRFRLQQFGLKRANIFEPLKTLILMNSKRVLQRSSPDIAECRRSFLDLRFSDFEDKEISTPMFNAMANGRDLRLELPLSYHRCFHCQKYRTDFVLCNHCNEALYCDSKCKTADSERHLQLVDHVEPPADVTTNEKTTQNNIDNANECNACQQKTTAAKACSQCKEVYYCDRKCQQNDWKNHKAACKKPSQKPTDPNLKKNLRKAFGTKQESGEDGKSGAGGDFGRGCTSNSQTKEDGVGVKENIDAAGDMKVSSDESKDLNTDVNHNKKSGINTNSVQNDVSVKRADEDESESGATTSSATCSTQCANCKGQACSTFTCSVCNTVKYCAYQCQLTHWPKHQKQCVQHLLSKLGQQL